MRGWRRRRQRGGIARRALTVLPRLLEVLEEVAAEHPLLGAALAPRLLPGLQRQRHGGGAAPPCPHPPPQTVAAAATAAATAASTPAHGAGPPGGPPGTAPTHRRAEAGSPSPCHRPGVGRKRGGSGGPDAASRAQEGGGGRRGPFLLPRRLETARAGRAGGTFARRSHPPQPRNTALPGTPSRTTGREVAPRPPAACPRRPRPPRLRPDALDTAPRVPRGGLFTSAAGRGGGSPSYTRMYTRAPRPPGTPTPPAPRLGRGGAQPRGVPSGGWGGREGANRGFWGRGGEGPGRGHQRPKCHQTASRAYPQRRRGKE